MSKLNKDVLKSIIKECLIEILAEGLGSKETISESFSAKTQSRQHIKPQTQQQKKKSIFDQMDESFAKTRTPDKRSNDFNRAVKQAVNIATSDPILQSILEDTAKTTYQEQMQHEINVPSFGNQNMLLNENFTSPTSAGLDLEGLFGSNVTKNWEEVVNRTT